MSSAEHLRNGAFAAATETADAVGAAHVTVAMGEMAASPPPRLQFASPASDVKAQSRSLMQPASLGTRLEPLEMETDAAHTEEQPQSRYRFPKGRAALALCFLLLGVSLGISGAALPSLAMGIVGLLLTLPGAYMSFIYCQLLRRNPAYMREAHRWMDIRDDDLP